MITVNMHDAKSRLSELVKDYGLKSSVRKSEEQL